MILCSSLNEFSPAKQIVHTLVKHGIPVHVSRSGRLSDVSPPTLVPLSTGRVRVKTFCAAKGLEAKLVIVLHHKSMFQKIENSLYVALTRSSEQLVIFQEASTTTHSDIEQLSMNVQESPNIQIHVHRTLPVTNPPEQNEDRPTQRILVDGMFNYVDPLFLLNLEKRLSVSTVDT
jgi:superfamily I DNA/RNA helicase